MSQRSARLHSLVAALGLAVVPLATTGCMMLLNGSARERAVTAAREYNEGIRWGRWNEVARQIEPTKRESFVARHERLNDELEFVDYEILSVTVKPTTPTEKDTVALARVHYEWTLRSRGLVERTDTEQRWKEENGQWVLEQEVRTKGAPLTCFDEKEVLPVKTAAATTPGVPTARVQ